jgi:hypothetical protein
MNFMVNNKTGGVEVYQMGVKVYQSALQEEIAITGSGFKAGISFNFEPDLKVCFCDLFLTCPQLHFHDAVTAYLA